MNKDRYGAFILWGFLALACWGLALTGFLENRQGNQEFTFYYDSPVLTGKEMEHLLHEANITCNKNAIPNDPESPFITSGVRLGTAAVTSRGMNQEDMDLIAQAIALMVKDRNNKEEAMAIVKSLTDKYPLMA